MHGADDIPGTVRTLPRPGLRPFCRCSGRRGGRPPLTERTALETRLRVMPISALWTGGADPIQHGGSDGPQPSGLPAETDRPYKRIRRVMGQDAKWARRRAGACTGRLRPRIAIRSAGPEGRRGTERRPAPAAASARAGLQMGCRAMTRRKEPRNGNGGRGNPPCAAPPPFGAGRPADAGRTAGPAASPDGGIAPFRPTAHPGGPGMAERWGGAGLPGMRDLGSDQLRAKLVASGVAPRAAGCAPPGGRPIPGNGAGGAACGGRCPVPPQRLQVPGTT